jgi:DNA repair protein SbcD/Mre11
MRLLHTSDWHLGRSFHREDLLGAQAAFIDFLVATVRDARIDAVLVSGDVYDRALPSLDAVRLCNEALRRLRDTGTRVILISGNHDSASRLGFGADLIDAAGIHLRTDPRRAGVPLLLDDAAGPVAVYGVPYLEPDAVRLALDCEGRSHQAVLGAAMAAVKSDLAGQRPGTRSVVMAHAFVTGAEPCESERDISVGGVPSVSATVFADVDYAALGHLHGAQRVTDTVRYSGSPVAYSFSEERHTKSVTIVELPDSPGGELQVELLPAPVVRPLARISGTLDDLLGGASFARFTDHYLQVTLTDDTRPPQAMDRLRQRFPHVLVLGFAPAGGPATTGPESYAARLAGRSDLEVAADFVAHVRGEAGPAELELLAEAFEAVRLAEASR